MKFYEFKKEIEIFRSSVEGYLRLLSNSQDDLCHIVRNVQEIHELMSALNKNYAKLEKYIIKIGKNPKMNDGANSGYYPVYNNAFSADILQRVGPSLEAVVQDLDYIIGKLDSMDEAEASQLFDAGVTSTLNEKLEIKKDTVDINKRIDGIKKIMADVATGSTNIQVINTKYKKIYAVINKYCKEEKIDNPNPYTDLWEFYAYWKDNLSSYAERRNYIIGIYKNFGEKIDASKTLEQKLLYVDLDRISELKKLSSEKFDLKKLIEFCKELNTCYENECYLASIVLLRCILNHVSPIFGFKTFKEVCNNYGKRSFKEHMEKLENSSRKIADSYLHDPIRKKETLPNKTQIYFSQDLDVLLCEIISLI